MKVILASGSPRRRELLKSIYSNFEVITSDADESISDCEPDKLVEELSYRKAKAVYDKVYDELDEDYMVIGADTIVYYDGEVLGKPIDSDDAKDMLSMLSNRTHQVYTGVTVIARVSCFKTSFSFSEKTDVTFYPIDSFEIADYVKTGSCLDKAGSYGIQDEFCKHVKKIDGDYNNVVGLPVSRFYQELKSNKFI